MAVFNKNSLSQISGFDNQIIAGELVYQQQTYWNLHFAMDTVPMDLTGCVIDAQIIRRQLENVVDTRNGLTFNIKDYNPQPAPIPLEIGNLDELGGTFTLLLNDSTWDLIASDPELEIGDVNGIGFSGRIKITFPEVGTTPVNDMIIFLFFIVRSDGVVKY
jgi:hypothetical protein